MTANIDIDKLKGGLELNVLVAERVFGLKLFTASLEQSAVFAGSRVRWGTWIDIGVMHEWGPQVDRLLPYSTFMAAAWQVVEHLATRFHWRIKSPFTAGDEWHAGLTPLGVTGWNGRPDFSADANTAPLAICQASLKAVMGQDA